jgi:hypothetical protein
LPDQDQTGILLNRCQAGFGNLKERRLHPEPTSLFRSSGQRGFSAIVAGNPGRVQARKLEREVNVRFTPVSCIIHTHEGTVHAKPGDAILCGIDDEQWRVSRERFAEKYSPLPPTRDGESGRYVSRRNHVLAVRMSEPFEVLLADGISMLRGRTRDWLVDYGDGSLGIVTAEIFARTYEILA